MTEADFTTIRGAQVPTLAEALEFTLRHKLPMNLEVKDQIHSPGDMSIVGDVLAEIRRAGAEDLILISSFNHDYLREVRRLGSTIPLGVLTEETHPDNIPEYVRSIGAQCYHPDADITPDDMVRELVAAVLKCRRTLSTTWTGRSA